MERITISLGLGRLWLERTGRCQRQPLDDRAGDDQLAPAYRYQIVTGSAQLIRERRSGQAFDGNLGRAGHEATPGKGSTNVRS